MSWQRWAVIVAFGVAAACNNGTSTNDSRTDLPRSDTPRPDQGTRDLGGRSDQGGTVDRSVVDGIKTDREVALDQKAGPDLAPDPCAGISCGLLNDCCDCYATNGPPPGQCKMLCKQNTCDALGIKPQVTYCVGGHCLVTAGATSCNADTDCQRVDNCCDCLALPKAASAPDCQKLCLINTCVSRGLATAKVRCILGECRLQK
jgi:hypothetical protein